jgi:hypothetical protein
LNFKDRAIVAVDEVNVVFLEFVVAFKFTFLFVAIDLGSVVEVGFDDSSIPTSFE